MAKAKARTGLPTSGLVLYYAMARLLEARRLRTARFMGELLQRMVGTNHSVNAVLATVYSQLRNPKDQCRALMEIVSSSPHDTDLLAQAGESAAYVGDAASLEKVRDLAARVSPPLQSYLEGLLAFVNGEANYQAHFQDSVRSFFRTNGTAPANAPEGSVSVLTKRYIESGREIPEFVRQGYNIRELSSIDQLLVDPPPAVPLSPPAVLDGAPETGLGRPDVIVLVSCGDCYLRAFADHFVRNLRRTNQNIVHFHVLADDVEATRSNLVALSERHTNVRYSIEPLSGKSQTYITLARFLVCRDVMRHYGSDVLISDIDLNLDFDLSRMCRELRSGGFDIGLCDMGYPVPWAKFAVGFSYFRVGTQASEVYVDLLSRYLLSLYAEGGFFSLDMTAATTIYEYMRARGYDLKVQNIHSVVDFERLIAVPKRLQQEKIKCKWTGGGPQ